MEFVTMLCISATTYISVFANEYDKDDAAVVTGGILAFTLAIAFFTFLI